MSDVPTLFWNGKTLPKVGDIFELKGQEARHGTKVLRIRPTSKVRLVDGQGNILICRVVESHHNVLKLKLIRLEYMESDLCPIFLAISILKSDKMDLVIQKSSEIGIERIYPLNTSRSVVRMDEKKAKRRMERWQELAKQALKQCKGAYLTHIYKPMEFSNFIKFSNGLEGAKIIIWERQHPSHGLNLAWGKQGKKQPVMLLVGPEGGFTTEESELACQNGFIPASLGKRILRAETAAIGASFMFRQLIDEIAWGSGASP